MTVMTLETSSLFVLTPEAIPTKRKTPPFSQNVCNSWEASLQATLREAKTQAASTKVLVKPEPADEQLLAAMCTGEESAIETLYERYQRYAYALAYRILRDPLAAEDIVQDAFLSVWRKASSYQVKNGSVQNWIQAIVRNRAIDKIRASAHRDYQWTPLQVENEQDPPSDEPDVWEQAWQSEQSRIIREVLEQIPGEQRMVIELAYFRGLTHAEISEQYHIPLGTVKGRMRLGLQKMKTLLAERGIGVI